MTNQDNTFKSDARFVEANINKFTADELNSRVNDLRSKLKPQLNIVSTYDIFDSNEDKYAPQGAHLSSVQISGKTVPFRALTKAVAAKIGGETGSTADASAMAAYFAFLSKQLEKSAGVINKNVEKNMAIRQNNMDIDGAYALYVSQYNHEKALNAAKLHAITAEEETQKRFAELEQTIADLKAAQTKTTKGNK